MEDELTPAQRGALEALKSTRGACPPPEALVEYEALPENDRAERPEHAHIQICSRCQLVMLHVGGAGEAGGAGKAAETSWKTWALPLAAVLVLAVGFTVTTRRDATTTIDPVDTVRGTELQVMAPAGAVEIIREFRWQSPIQAERYRVIVRRAASGASERIIVWQGETTGLSLAPPPSGVIERDVQYEWLVEAIDREGNVRMTSPPQPFLVY
jgi:hypothetical protein